MRAEGYTGKGYTQPKAKVIRIVKNVIKREGISDPCLAT